MGIESGQLNLEAPCITMLRSRTKTSLSTPVASYFIVGIEVCHSCLQALLCCLYQRLFYFNSINVCRYRTGPQPGKIITT